MSSVPSVSSSPQHLFWYDWASSRWTRLGLCSPNRNRNHRLTQTDQTEKVISCNTIVDVPVRAGPHIWCRACDIAAPVVSSSAELQGAERLKVWSWRKKVKRTSGWFWPFTNKQRHGSVDAIVFVDRDAVIRASCQSKGQNKILQVSTDPAHGWLFIVSPLPLLITGNSIQPLKSNPGTVTQPQKGSNYKPCRLFIHTSHHIHQ